MWRRILAYFLFGLGLLTITFFRKYSGEFIPYPFLFYLAGLAMFIVGLLLLRNTPTSKELILKKQIEDLKANSDKIYVDLLQCEIKENNYTEEQDKLGKSNGLLTYGFEQEIQLLDALSRPKRNFEEAQINQTVIIYNYQNNRTGKAEKFVSRIINKDRITLSFYLEKQNNTTLYVDKVNRDRYYFDLAFLNN